MLCQRLRGYNSSVMREPQPAIFLDRDGTINEDIGYVSSPAELTLYPWAARAIRLINEAGWKAIVITNQSGVARGLYTEEILGDIHNKMIEEMKREGARVDAVYYCPHHPEIGDHRYRLACDCRKPQAGLLYRAASDHNIDLAGSFVIGDKSSDIQMAERAGARSALVLTGYGIYARDECNPGVIAENLLAAVRLILDIKRPQDVNLNLES